MEARYVSRIDSLLDPSGAVWKTSRPERVKLEPTPLVLQPTDAIRSAWEGKKIGAVTRVDVAAVHDDNVLAFRLEWDDPTENRLLGDNTDFPDAAAVLFPSVAAAPIITMGAPALAVNAWFWRADVEDEVRNVVAEGIGTSRTIGAESGRASASWKEGRWRVVLARALRVDTADPVAQLESGASTGLAVAIWDGANGERGGIKAYSGPHWKELVLEAPQSASARR